MPAIKANTYQLLRNKYPENECVLMCEVSDSTGFRNRSADYIVVNLWPSRGNSVIGFEEKTYRSDWLNEMKNPKKQEAIFKYCDFFYLITSAENVAKLEEIPANWGWMHCKGNRILLMKPAPKLNPEPLSRQFVCSMLRRAASKEGFIHTDSIEDRIKSKVAEAIAKAELESGNVAKDYNDLKEKVEVFEKTSGIPISDRRWIRNKPEKMGEAVVKIVDGALNTSKQVNSLISLKEGLSQTIDYINSGIADLKSIQEVSDELHSNKKLKLK